MLINEVEKEVGLSKKSIRYYEEQGLITPKRNLENGYREYSSKDLKELIQIKFLRELGIPINDIYKIKHNELTLKDSMNDVIKKIQNEEENYQTVKSMCQEIIKKNETYNSLDINKYMVTINRLKKKGFRLMDINKDHRKKITGAVLSSVIFCLFISFFIVALTYLQTTEDKMPTIFYLIFTFILMGPIIGTIYNLVIRIIEIKKGEEDEASKY